MLVAGVFITPPVIGRRAPCSTLGLCLGQRALLARRRDAAHRPAARVATVSGFRGGVFLQLQRGHRQLSERTPNNSATASR